jgi:hypothetical protein
MKKYQYYVIWASGEAFGKSKIVLDTKIKSLKEMEGLEALICKEGKLELITILNYFEFEITEEKELMGPRN